MPEGTDSTPGGSPQNVEDLTTMRFRTALLAAAAIAAIAGQAPAAQLLTNGSFEAPGIGAGNYTYPGLPYGTIAPVGAVLGGWTYAGAALVNGSGSSAWYGGAAPAGMDGVQFVALQNAGSIRQSFTASASTLHLSWLDAGRPSGMGDQTYNILLDGVAQGGIFSTLSGEAFGLNNLTLSGLTAGQSYDLSFKGLVASGDETAFLDRVSLTDTAPLIGPSISVVGASPALGVGEFMIQDFDNPIASGFNFAQGPGAYVRSGALGLDPGVSAPPPGVTSNYETIVAGGSATLTSLANLQSLSFYMGSPDSYNRVVFSGEDGFSWSLSGAQIWNAMGAANGDQSWGRRVSYDFGDYSVNRVEFSSSGNSFEFDAIAGVFKSSGLSVSAAPEPATWLMMIMGFGAIGGLLRRQRKVLTQA